MSIRSVILAGGKGTRLRPLTAVFPKPLVPLGSKAIIEILLRRLKQFGLTDVTLCTGYLSEMIMALCGDGSKFGLNIDYVHEEQPLGTAGPLALLEKTTDPIIVMNGDLLTTMNFSKMLESHRATNADITIGVYQREVKIDFGVVEKNPNDKFVGFKEKPTYHFDVSMGVNIIGKAAIKHIKEKGKYLDMPDLILAVNKSGGKVNCYQEDCFWLDIGRLDDYGLSQKEFEENEERFLSVT